MAWSYWTDLTSAPEDTLYDKLEKKGFFKKAKQPRNNKNLEVLYKMYRDTEKEYGKEWDRNATTRARYNLRAPMLLPPGMQVANEMSNEIRDNYGLTNREFAKVQGQRNLPTDQLRAELKYKAMTGKTAPNANRPSNINAIMGGGLQAQAIAGADTAVRPNAIPGAAGSQDEYKGLQYLIGAGNASNTTANLAHAVPYGAAAVRGVAKARGKEMGNTGKAMGPWADVENALAAMGQGKSLGWDDKKAEYMRKRTAAYFTKFGGYDRNKIGNSPEFWENFKGDRKQLNNAAFEVTGQVPFMAASLAGYHSKNLNRADTPTIQAIKETESLAFNSPKAPLSFSDQLRSMGAPAGKNIYSSDKGLSARGIGEDIQRTFLGVPTLAWDAADIIELGSILGKGDAALQYVDEAQDVIEGAGKEATKKAVKANFAEGQVKNQTREAIERLRSKKRIAKVNGDAAAVANYDSAIKYLKTGGAKGTPNVPLNVRSAAENAAILKNEADEAVAAVRSAQNPELQMKNWFTGDFDAFKKNLTRMNADPKVYKEIVENPVTSWSKEAQSVYRRAAILSSEDTSLFRLPFSGGKGVGKGLYSGIDKLTGGRGHDVMTTIRGGNTGTRWSKIAQHTPILGSPSAQLTRSSGELTGGVIERGITEEMGLRRKSGNEVTQMIHNMQTRAFHTTKVPARKQSDVLRAVTMEMSRSAGDSALDLDTPMVTRVQDILASKGLQVDPKDIQHVADTLAESEVDMRYLLRNLTEETGMGDAINTPYGKAYIPHHAGTKADAKFLKKYYGQDVVAPKPDMNTMHPRGAVETGGRGYTMSNKAKDLLEASLDENYGGARDLNMIRALANEYGLRSRDLSYNEFLNRMGLLGSPLDVISRRFDNKAGKFVSKVGQKGYKFKPETDPEKRSGFDRLWKYSRSNEDIPDAVDTATGAGRSAGYVDEPYGAQSQLSGGDWAANQQAIENLPNPAHYDNGEWANIPIARDFMAELKDTYGMKTFNNDPTKVWFSEGTPSLLRGWEQPGGYVNLADLERNPVLVEKAMGFDRYADELNPQTRIKLSGSQQPIPYSYQDIEMMTDKNGRLLTSWEPDSVSTNNAVRNTRGSVTRSTLADTFGTSMLHNHPTRNFPLSPPDARFAASDVVPPNVVGALLPNGKVSYIDLSKTSDPAAVSAKIDAVSQEVSDALGAAGYSIDDLDSGLPTAERIYTNALESAYAKHFPDEYKVSDKWGWLEDIGWKPSKTKPYVEKSVKDLGLKASQVAKSFGGSRAYDISRLGNEDFINRYIRRLGLNDYGSHGGAIGSAVNRTMMPLMTSARPAFMAKNVFGNITNTALTGNMDIGSQIRAGRDVLEIARQGGNIPLRLKSAMSKGVISPMEYNPTTWFDTSLSQSPLENVPGLGRVLRGSRHLNSAMETQARLGAYYKFLEDGMTESQAARNVNRILYNYELPSLNAGEQWMKQFMPFYTFPRRNIPFQVQQAKNPAYWWKQQRLLNAIDPNRVEHQEQMPGGRSEQNTTSVKVGDTMLNIPFTSNDAFTFAKNLERSGRGVAAMAQSGGKFGRDEAMAFPSQIAQMIAPGTAGAASILTAIRGGEMPTLAAMAQMIPVVGTEVAAAQRQGKPEVLGGDPKALERSFYNWLTGFNQQNYNPYAWEVADTQKRVSELGKANTAVANELDMNIPTVDPTGSAIWDGEKYVQAHIDEATKKLVPTLTNGTTTESLAPNYLNNKRYTPKYEEYGYGNTEQMTAMQRMLNRTGQDWDWSQPEGAIRAILESLTAKNNAADTKAQLEAQGLKRATVLNTKTGRKVIVYVTPEYYAQNYKGVRVVNRKFPKNYQYPDFLQTEEEPTY